MAKEAGFFFFQKQPHTHTSCSHAYTPSTQNLGCERIPILLDSLGLTDGHMVSPRDGVNEVNLTDGPIPAGNEQIQVEGGSSDWWDGMTNQMQSISQ